MSESLDAIRRVVEAHLLKTHSTTRGSIIKHHAGCTCDPDLEFDWYERESQHRDHLHLAIFDAGRTTQDGQP
jgi:hypothetical protein